MTILPSLTFVARAGREVRPQRFDVLHSWRYRVTSQALSRDGASVIESNDS